METKIKGYHYTNPRDYRSMQTKGTGGHIGLVPGRRFITLGYGNGLPDEAYDGVIYGLLEAEPKSWLENPEFPNLLGYLINHICKDKEVVLLSFKLEPEDRAYVVDRAYMERELYKESKGQGISTKETRNEAFRSYWESRVPVFNYNGSYTLPELVIWSGIEFDRLKKEWIKPANEVWQRFFSKTQY